MKLVVALILFTGLLIINACGDTPQETKIKNPLAGHAEALEKAKDVERQLLEAAEKQSKAIDQISK